MTWRQEILDWCSELVDRAGRDLSNYFAGMMVDTVIVVTKNFFVDFRAGERERVLWVDHTAWAC